MATYTGSPSTVQAGDTILASLWNSDVRDVVAALSGAWNSWTPTLAQGASTDIAKTVTYAKYIQVGKFVVAQLKVAATAAGTAGSSITLTLPVTAATGAGYNVGSGEYADSGGTPATIPFITQLASTTTLLLIRTDATRTGAIGADPNIAVASGDDIALFMFYEAA